MGAEANGQSVAELWCQTTAEDQVILHERKIEGNPVTAVEVLGDKLNVNQEERSGILTHLIQGGDLTAYGMMNAVTRTSQDVESYDRATELEAMGSQVLSLPKATWREIAVAR
ncbi:hypothetical protein [Acaryochloris marina]|uniref:hypothetical protein n=1 Tax=Acaryochloris marina TaxID=155978 RepID=UPI0021C2B606|nr:hypothetical protein [Acaryochloris marina]BDM83216.1 hypothetical protein AM10699_60770 [Acaryochloris marina MBIC10699]